MVKMVLFATTACDRRKTARNGTPQQTNFYK